jgi:hypothetical protein
MSENNKDYTKDDKDDKDDKDIKDDKDNKIDNTKYILDPLSVIIKLFILSKKKIGCKLCIYNNILHIQDIGAFQSIIRYYYKNTKTDIQYLYNPIELASLHFLNKDFVKKFPSIKNLFINAHKGLENLIGTYTDFTFIVHTLYMYNNIISNHLGDKYNERLFIRDNMSNMYSPDITNKLNSIWSPNKIKFLLNIIDFINKTNNSVESIKCLEEFVTSVDKEVEVIIKTIQ